MRTGLRVAAAAALVTAAGAVGVQTPAYAEACGTAQGVTVIVDFNQLGGGLEQDCVADGGGDTAAASFEVHHDLTRVAQFPGAVCRVDGAPSSAGCQTMPPTNAYWGLFWSDGSGGWVYSSESVDNLNIPEGGSVAFAWQNGGETDQPGVAPPQHGATEEPSSSPSPSQGPGGSGGGSGGSDGGGGATAQPREADGTAGPGADPTRSAPGEPGSGSGAGDRSDEQRNDRTQARDRDKDRDEKRDGQRDRKRDRDGRERSEPTESAEPETSRESVSPAATSEPVDAGDGLPAWVAPVVAAGLFVVAGVAAYLRRRAA